MSRPPVPPPVPKDDDSTREAYTRRLRRKTPDPTEDAVTHKLRRARRDTGRYPERDRFLPALADCIAAELKAVPGEAVRQRAALLMEMGHLEEVVLGDGESSLAHYRRAHRIDPSHVPAQRALARRLLARGHRDELIQVLESELEVVSREEHRSALLARLGEIHAFHLEDTAGAVDRKSVV